MVQNKETFLKQLPSGQWPSLLVNVQEKKTKPVDTLAITIMVVYLAQVSKQNIVDVSVISSALDFIEKRCYINEVEGYRVWHFNSFYPPDWEDTAMAVYLFLKNRRLKFEQLEPLRNLLIQNTSDNGTGVWIKDPYSKGNSQRNHWDPTTATNILRLHYLLGVDRRIVARLEGFVVRNLNLKNFYENSLYYSPALSAFFAKRLLIDFPEASKRIGKQLESFYSEVISAIYNKKLEASYFEKALLGIGDIFPERDPGLIFHHGRRFNVWYGSPILYELAKAVNF